jgi:hypothetical protein
MAEGSQAGVTQEWANWLRQEVQWVATNAVPRRLGVSGHVLSLDQDLRTAVQLTAQGTTCSDCRKNTTTQQACHISTRMIRHAGHVR